MWVDMNLFYTYFEFELILLFRPLWKSTHPIISAETTYRIREKSSLVEENKVEMYVDRVYNTIQSSQATGQRTLMVADDDDGLATLTSMVIVNKK